MPTDHVLPLRPRLTLRARLASAALKVYALASTSSALFLGWKVLQ